MSLEEDHVVDRVTGSVIEPTAEPVVDKKSVAPSKVNAPLNVIQPHPCDINFYSGGTSASGRYCAGGRRLCGHTNGRIRACT